MPETQDTRQFCRAAGCGRLALSQYGVAAGHFPGGGKIPAVAGDKRPRQGNILYPRFSAKPTTLPAVKDGCRLSASCNTKKHAFRDLPQKKVK
jgi:hypothetical protein